MKILRPLGILLVIAAVYGLWCYKAWGRRPGISIPLVFDPVGDKTLREWVKTQELLGNPPFSAGAFLKAPFTPAPGPMMANLVRDESYRGIYVTHPSRPDEAVEFTWSDSEGYHAPHLVPLKEMQAKEFDAIKPKLKQIPIPGQ